MTAINYSNPRVELNELATKLYDDHGLRIATTCDRMFATLFLLEWIGGIVCAAVITPHTWIGQTSSLHLHFGAAIFLGAAIFSMPLYLVATRSGSKITRHTIAVAQMLYAALLIHLTGGRIETHFHIFGSLAFLAFYRDWRVLVTATVVITVDHFIRGVFWSESVFGVAYAGQWRWIEHAGWVIFEDIFLVMSCIHARREMAEIAVRQADTIEQANQRSTTLTLALTDQQDLLTALDSGAIIVTKDASGRILSVNDKFCEISGYSREEMIGKDHRIIALDQHPPEFWSTIYAVAAKGGVWHGEIRNRAKNGRIWWADTTIKGILGSDGTLQKMVAVRTDITDRKHAETHMHQSQKLESIGQLAAGIAHEINTPTQYVGDNIRFLQTQFGSLMTIVETYAAELDGSLPSKPWTERKAKVDKMMQEMDFGFLREEIPQAISQSLEGVNRVAMIVGAMKDFSHPGSDTKEPADLNRSIASTIEVCRARWKYVADLEIDLADDMPPVSCLVAEFNQVILNLMVNAADAIGDVVGAGGVQKGLIRVSSRLIGDSAEIRIQDNGPGIPDAIKGRMFEQFFTTKPVGKGTGQGLALSRSVIVNKHGGKLFFESTLGKGTTFIIQMPVTDGVPHKLVAA